MLSAMKKPKRPKDPVSNAVLVGRMLTGEIPKEPASDGKDPAAKALGARGGAARAKSLSSERKAEIARKAAKKRWGNQS